MTGLIIFLIFCQALGAFVGVIMAVLGEMAYIRAIRDVEIDEAESKHLIILGDGLRFGMTLSLVSSLVLVSVSYAIKGPQPALTASYWIFIVLSLLIVAISWALARRNISFALGSAAALTAWWLLAYATLGRLPVSSFASAVALYVVPTAVVYAVLKGVRFFVTRQHGGASLA